MDTEPRKLTPGSQAHPEAPKPPAVLLVDDHYLMRSSLKDWFACVFPQFKILEADSGESALALFDFVSPRLVLMDFALPGMNGIEAARQIRAFQPETKIVMLSIHDEQQYREDAQKAGVSAFFSKSGLRADLFPALKELLGVGDEP